MNKSFNRDIYINAEYLIKDASEFIVAKYGRNAKFVLKETATKVFGNDWLGDFPSQWNFHQDSIVINFLARMSARGIMNFDNHVVVYGKVYDVHEHFGTNELFILRDLELQMDIKEFKSLIKKNKIKIKSL